MSATINPTSYHTRTGRYPIGFRRMGSDWCQDTASLIEWALRKKFSVIDLGPNAETEITLFEKAGIHVGTVDLLEWGEYPLMLSEDRNARDQAVASAVSRIRACSALGAKVFFTLMVTDGDNRPAWRTLEIMLESYRELNSVLQETGSQVSIEGWPELGAQCCNPEACRAFLKGVGSTAFGINYDPSHLIRLGIDHIRFLREFAPQIVHVHGKDTEIFPEKTYEMGHEQRLAKLGGEVWRYTIPGHGQARWPMIFQILEGIGYAGAVCIEHEDAAFLGTSEAEKMGLIYSGEFLASC
jgi:sugar phosphate isomerase/epimerase